MRWFNWLRKEEAIKSPGICQCGHKQCYHSGGDRHCWEYGCSCVIYLEVDDPEVSELERIYKR